MALVLEYTDIVVASSSMVGINGSSLRILLSSIPQLCNINKEEIFMNEKEESVPVHYIGKDGSINYRNFRDMSSEDKQDIDKIHFSYTRDKEKYGKGLNCASRDEVVPQSLEDVYTGKDRQ